MQTNTPLVSVLMTAFNRETYLSQAVYSVLASTYQNWELIILDDCSTDSTFHLAQQLAIEDSRIRVFKNDYNLGQFKNRNKIVEYAEGKYLKYLDSDDLIYPYGLEQLVFYMEQYPEAGYGLCSIEQDNEKVFPILLSPEDTYKRHFIEGKPVFHKAPLSSIIKTSAFREIGGFPHEAVSGDFAIWLYLSLKSNVVLMPQGMVWYRIHAAQEMQKTRDSVLVEFEYFKVEEYFLKLPECPLKKEKRDEVIKNNLNKQKKYIFWKFRQRGFGAFKQLLRFKNAPFVLNKV